jgi:hypothetical protein
VKGEFFPELFVWLKSPVLKGNLWKFSGFHGGDFFRFWSFE